MPDILQGGPAAATGDPRAPVGNHSITNTREFVPSPMNVLVTDGATNKALAVVRALGDAPERLGVSSRFPVSPAGLSRYADDRHWLRDRRPDALVAAFNDLATDGRYDYLLPVGGETFEFVSEHRDELDFPVGDILPGREAMRTAVRKAETYRLADREDVPVPKTVRLTSEDGVDRAADVVGFPAVLKTGVETEERFVRRVDSTDEIRAAYRDYADSHESAPLVQEALPGDGRGYFGLCVDGELVAGYAHRRIREYPPEGGASACAVSEDDDELREYSERLLSALDWTGVAMVEFKEAADGTPAVVEMNPKFWGSLDLAIASGLNLPRALLSYAETGRVDRSDLEFTPQRVHWPLSGDLTHAWRRPRSAPAVARDLISPETTSNLRADDPLPHTVEALITLVRRDI
ncbi:MULTISPECIES: ATP-grasp domain-containing protein [Salinibaculum]|uniref:carboxylate--amine ligase n=1 Tax=Salinibaculum TaxID=2732368 RepID=UPI0030CB1BF1